MVGGDLHPALLLTPSLPPSLPPSLTHLPTHRFKDVDEPQDAACGLAQALQLLPPQEVLSAGYLYEEYDPAAIESMLMRLTPHTACVTHCSRRSTVATSVVVE